MKEEFQKAAMRREQSMNRILNDLAKALVQLDQKEKEH